MAILTFTEVASTPTPPAAGQADLYIKTDNVVYTLSSGGVETPLGSSSAITSLTGGGTATGPGAATLTLTNSAVTGQLLTGYTAGSNTPITGSNTILTAFENVQAQISASSGSAITALTGDVSATGPGSVAATVNSVGGQTAATIASAVIEVDNATSSNTASTLVLRDASGNFSANIVTASLNGNANTATTSTNFSGSLSGDVTGTQTATSISKIQGTTVSGTTGSGNVIFSASPTLTGTITAGSANFSGAISASNFSGSSSGTNTGNVTVTNTNSIDLAFTSGQTGLNATLNISIAGPSAGFQIANSSIQTDGLLVQVPYGNAVNVGTTNMTGSSSMFALADHVHALTAPVTTGQLLTGYTTGTNIPITASNTILQAFENLQAQVSETTGAAITALTGDVTATGPGSAVATVQAIQGHSVSNTPPTDAQILIYNSTTSKWTPETISGDATLVDTGVLTLSSVNSNVGSFGSSTSIPSFTVNAKGLITAASGNAVVAPAGTLTGTTLASNVVSSSLTSVGTITSGTWNGTTIAIGNGGTGLTALPTNGQLLIGNTSGSDYTLSTLTAGTGISITNGSGSITLSTTGAPPTGSAGGDLSGTYPNPTVAKIQTYSVSSSAPTDAQLLIYVNGTTSWTPTSLSGDVTITDGGVATLSSTGVTPTSYTLTNLTVNAEGRITTASNGIVNLTSQVTGILPIANGGTNNSSAYTAGSIIFSNGTSLTQDNANFYWNDTNQSIGIGTATPASNAFFDAVNTTAATKRLVLTGYGVGSTVGFRNRFARGTSGSSLAVQSGDTLGFISGQGYGASQFPAASTGAANFIAGETFTNTSNLTYFTVNTTPTGSVTSTENFRVASTGVTLGPQSSSTAIHTTNGGVIRTTRTITTNLTVDSGTTDDIILCNQSGAITITLPTPTVGRTIVIKDISGNAQTNPISVAQHASETIEGLAATKVLYTNYGGWTFTVGAAGNWWMC